MTAVPSRAVSIDQSARDIAQATWAPQIPANRRRRQQLARRRRTVDVQLALIAIGGLVFALTFPSWLGVILIVAGWIVPALVAAWLDTYRPINAAAIDMCLDQGAAQ